jgi:L-alanine-DL-glutamate epimerase-like enolase superfamily enzyme
MKTKPAMRIHKVNIYKISLPFTADFSHSRRKGNYAENVIVEVITGNGEIKGYGEAAPRTYVTGESQESAAKNASQFLHKDSFPWELNDVSQIWKFIDCLPSEKEYNSAVCALEMSLLDTLAKIENKSITEYFPKDYYTNRVNYGAGIPFANSHRIIEICRFIKKMKINRVKIKMGKDFSANQKAVEAVNSVFGDSCDLKIDINMVWNHELALKHIPLIKKYKVKVVEQPMPPGDASIGHFSKILQDNGVILMADESACSLKDVERILKEGHYKMVNVRLSKCGGFQRSLRIIEYLRANGISFQIASHLGESGILSAAGRVLSLLCKDASYYDGSYDEFLLKENVTMENVTFGPGGEAGPLDGQGLGVEINSESLDRLSCNSKRVTVFRP